MSLVPLYISEKTVKRVLTWPMVIEATKGALSATSNQDQKDPNFPIAEQPARSFTWTSEKTGVLLSMPGYVGEHSVGNEKLNSLGCKLVTSFSKNAQLPVALPNILANILLFDSCTGQLKCILEATEITAWRTAGASLNATKYLYFERAQSIPNKGQVLAILGCGVQGRIHAIGMCSTFNLSEIRLWNRTESKANDLETDLCRLKKDTFQNPNIKIRVVKTVDECVTNADIIVTATFASQPFLHWNQLKDNVHINAIGAGVCHYSELETKIYEKGHIYVDNLVGAKVELAGLNGEIIGEVGEVINGSKKPPTTGITIFQSMGMAAEDITVAHSIYEAVKNSEGDELKLL